MKNEHGQRGGGAKQPSVESNSTTGTYYRSPPQREYDRRNFEARQAMGNKGGTESNRGDGTKGKPVQSDSGTHTNHHSYPNTNNWRNTNRMTTDNYHPKSKASSKKMPCQ